MIRRRPEMTSLILRARWGGRGDESGGDGGGGFTDDACSPFMRNAIVAKSDRAIVQRLRQVCSSSSQFDEVDGSLFRRHRKRAITMIALTGRCHP